jgi:hypothetical protein
MPKPKRARKPVANKKTPIVHEVQLADAMAALRSSTDEFGRRWKRMATAVRDPDDLTRILSVTIHER